MLWESMVSFCDRSEEILFVNSFFFTLASNEGLKNNIRLRCIDYPSIFWVINAIVLQLAKLHNSRLHYHIRLFWFSFLYLSLTTWALVKTHFFIKNGSIVKYITENKYKCLVVGKKVFISRW